MQVILSNPANACKGGIISIRKTECLVFVDGCKHGVLKERSMR